MRGVVSWLLFVVLCFAAAVSGALFPPGDWYAALDKPSWTPPNQVFAPVWSTLYVLMATAGWLVWRQRAASSRSIRPALTLFAVQLALNALWTPVFFGAHRVFTALIVIVLLWVAIVATIVAFRRHSAVAALLLVPYLLWVSLASALNFELWRLNS